MRSLWISSCCLAGFAFAMAADHNPSPGAERYPFRNLDVRRSQPRSPQRLPVHPSPPDRTDRDAGIQVDQNELIQAPKFVRDVGGLLTSDETADGGEPTKSANQVVAQYLNENSDLFGYGGEALRAARILRDYTSPASGLRTVTWQQYLVGIPIFEGVLSASMTDANGLVALSTQFFPHAVRAAATGPERRRTIDAMPRISARQAAAAAMASINEAADARPFASRRIPPNGWSEQQELTKAGLNEPVNADLVWFPATHERLRLAWRIRLRSRAGNLYQVLVDARSGEPQLRHSWSHGVAGNFRVFASDSPSPFSPGHALNTATNQPLDVSTPGPEFASQVDIVASNNAASPLGWINDSAAFNFQNTTIGNNVDAHLDLFDINPGYDEPIPTPPEARPWGVLSNGAVHLRFTADLSQPPLVATNVPATTNQKAAVVNAFYWCNWMHDRLWELGFTEAAGNFQRDNLGRGGLGNDPVLVDVQNRAALGNRNAGFYSASPADGTPVRISLAVWSGPSPEREGAFDAEVLLHEYVHLLTTRRVGNGVGLSSEEALGLAEGWSDFLSLCLLSQPGDDLAGAYAYGAFSTYRWTFGSDPLAKNYHYGMRRYPYSTDMAKNPLTFNDLDALDATGHLAVAVSPAFQPYDPLAFSFEAHCIGELWGVTLWEAFANLVQKHGFNAGRELLLRMILDGLSLCPANPTVLQARDALLLADRVLTGGANWNELWRAFAKRGLGWSAPEPTHGGIPRVTPAFDLPPSGQLLPGWPFVAKNAVRSSPALGTNAIYVGSNDGRLYSLTPGGTTNWVFFPSGLAAFSSSPAVHPDGTIYARRKNGWLYALRPNGTLKWSNRVDSASTGSPAVAGDGTIYIPGDKDLTALHPNGTLKWKFLASKTIDSSPSIGADGTIYFGNIDGRMYAIEPISGTLRSGWPFAAGKSIVSSPAISASGTIYFGSLSKRIYALNGITGAKLWEFSTGGPVHSSPALDTNGTVFVGSDDCRIYALTSAAGQLKWSYRTGGAVRSSPAVSSEGIVYVGSSDGHLYALSGGSGQLIYRFKVGGNVYSSPVISPEGSLYVGSSNGKVIGLRGSAGPANSDWPMFRREARRLANVVMP